MIHEDVETSQDEIFRQFLPNTWWSTSWRNKRFCVTKMLVAWPLLWDEVSDLAVTVKQSWSRYSSQESLCLKDAWCHINDVMMSPSRKTQEEEDDVDEKHECANADEIKVSWKAWLKKAQGMKKIEKKQRKWVKNNEQHAKKCTEKSSLEIPVSERISERTPSSQRQNNSTKTTMKLESDVLYLKDLLRPQSMLFESKRLRRHAFKFIPFSTLFCTTSFHSVLSTNTDSLCTVWRRILEITQLFSQLSSCLSCYSSSFPLSQYWFWHSSSCRVDSRDSEQMRRRARGQKNGSSTRVKKACESFSDKWVVNLRSPRRLLEASCCCSVLISLRFFGFLVSLDRILQNVCLMPINALFLATLND